MKFIPLHIKTALLASLVSLTALAVGLIVVSVSIARQVQEEQKQLAALQAENLSEQLSVTIFQYDTERLRSLTNIVSGSRPNLITVRVWKLETGKFVESASSDDSSQPEELDADFTAALQKRAKLSSVNSANNGETDSLFRVLSPIVENNQVVGAVEAVERLDTISTIAARYAANLWWVALATVGLMTIAFYLLFQRIVYQPLDNLLGVMERAKASDLTIQIEENEASGEFKFLSENFNSMMRQIREMTAEREKRNEILQTKISEATAELRRKNEQMETANLELFAATRRMREMERLAAAGQTAAQFAHEVGTPLNLISGHVQLLKMNLSPDSKDAKRLELITEQIERIEKIVREMLDRTRFGTSEHSPLDINSLLRKIFDAIEPTLEEHKVKLRSELAENLPLIQGDADRLQQVFINLVNNSLDAMPAGGEIFVSTAKRDEKVEVVFSDTGTGLTAETKAKIFQPLFTTKRRGHGTGLGLFVVKEILQEHGAEISVESESGKGTKFTMLFKNV